MMKRNDGKIKKNGIFITILLACFLLFHSSYISYTNAFPDTNNIAKLKDSIDTSRLGLWSCQINTTANSQPPQTDYVIIRENTNSTDGPPSDLYDVEDPPAGPSQEINAYLNDNLQIPKQKLIVDSRYGPDDDFYKIFNLTISWLFNPNPTQINITWNPENLNMSEYRYINLTDDTFSFLVNMKNASKYSFTANSFSYNYFHIECEKQAPPDAGVVSILGPSGIIPINGPSDVSVKVKNYCVQNLNDVQVNCIIKNNNSDIVYEDNQTVNLSPLGQIITFFEDWIPNTEGEFTIQSCVSLLNDKNSSNDCSSSNVTVDILPVSNFSYEPLNPRTDDIVQFTDKSIDSDGYIVNWTWNLGDGTMAYTPNVTHMYNQDDNYLVCLTVKDNSGFTHSNCELIEVLSAIPIASFIFDPVSPSTFEIINFSDTSSDYDGTIINWTWDFGDGAIAYEQNPSHYYQENQVYTVTLHVIDDDGEINSTSQLLVISNSAPHANFTYSPINPTTVDTISFIDVSNDIDGTIVNWTWDFGDENSSFNQNTSHHYTKISQYLVSLQVRDDDGGINTHYKMINVTNVLPTANFSFSPQDASTFDTIEFFDLSSDVDGFIISWQWDFGDGSNITIQNTTHQYSDGGDFLVCLTVEDNDGGFNMVCKTVAVQNREPNANFTFSPKIPNQTDTIIFTDLSDDLDGDIDSWEWDFDDGNFSFEQNPTYQYSTSGLYHVSLTVTDDDGASSTTISKLVPFGLDLYFVENLSTGWNFVSPPLNSTLLKNDLLIRYNEFLYEFDEGFINNFIFGWNRLNQYYTFADNLEPGYGYWMFSYENCELWITNETEPYDEYITTLNMGWNSIGIPYNQPIQKTNLLVNDTNWNTAVSNGWVSNYIFGWNQNGQYYEFSDTLIPSKSYWMYAFQTYRLKRAL